MNNAICDGCGAVAATEKLPPGWMSLTMIGAESHREYVECYCPACVSRQEDPGFEPPNCYVPGEGWRVV